MFFSKNMFQSLLRQGSFVTPASLYRRGGEEGVFQSLLRQGSFVTCCDGIHRTDDGRVSIPSSSGKLCHAVIRGASRNPHVCFNPFFVREALSLIVRMTAAAIAVCFNPFFVREALSPLTSRAIAPHKVRRSICALTICHVDCAIMSVDNCRVA